MNNVSQMNNIFKVNYLKETKIRNDIIESSKNISNINEILKVFKKSVALNKNIKKDFGQNVISIYKRSLNILVSEKKNLSEILLLFMMIFTILQV